jgi:D-arabinose 1-dehydrogenase-like Zn-dependent alcohol dehydrogenase
MATFGHISALTIAERNLEFPYLPLVVKELSIHGSCSSSLAEIKQMLQFIVDHKIKPKVEKFPM